MEIFKIVWPWVIENVPPLVIVVIAMWVFNKRQSQKGDAMVGHTDTINAKLDKMVPLVSEMHGERREFTKRFDNFENRFDIFEKQFVAQKSDCTEKFKKLFNRYDSLPVVNPDGKGKKHENVLVVDDDYAIICLIKNYLEPLGYNVKSAETFEEAEDSLSKFHFDWVLLDIVLNNGHSGYKLWEKINNLSGGRTRQILMTGYSMEDNPPPKEVFKHLTDGVTIINKTGICDKLKDKMSINV